MSNSSPCNPQQLSCEPFFIAVKYVVNIHVAWTCLSCSTSLASSIYSSVILLVHYFAVKAWHDPFCRLFKSTIVALESLDVLPALNGTDGYALAVVGPETSSQMSYSDIKLLQDPLQEYGCHMH